MIRQVPFFKDQNKEVLHAIVYNLQQNFYEKGDTINRKRDFCQNLVFVESGCVEAVDDFEGNDFVIERLLMGSVINLRTFILQEMVIVTLICAEPTKTLEISYKELEVLTHVYPEFSKNFRLFQNTYFKSNKRYPLDYIVGIPINQ